MKFYRIKSSFFVIGDKFSVPIYLYDVLRGGRMVMAYPDAEITQEMLTEWEELEAKGCYLQIFKGDKESLIAESKITNSDILEENEFHFKMIQMQTDRLKKYKALASENYPLRAAVEELAKSSDYSYLIKKVHAEVMCLPLYKDEELSLLIDIIDKCFQVDCLQVKEASFAYMLAKSTKITDSATLCRIIVAVLVKDLGLLLFKNDLFLKYKDFIKSDEYQRHPMLSMIILGRFEFELSEDIKEIVLEHHEVGDGTGFPRGKKEEKISLNSFIANSTSQIIQYSEGYITGQKVDLLKVISFFSNRSVIQGLQTAVPVTLADTFGSLLPTDYK